MVWEHPPFALLKREGEAETSRMKAIKKRTIVETLSDLMVAK